MNLLDGSLLWILAATTDLLGGGIRVRAAPCGQHFGPQTTMVLGWSVLEVAEIDPCDVSTLLGRRLLVRPHGFATILPPMIRGRRPLLVAPCRARSAWGARALESLSGQRLAGAAGMDLGALLETFETVNVLDAEGESATAGLRRLVESGRLENRVIVTVGEGTDRALRRYVDERHHNATILGWVIQPSGSSPLLQGTAVDRVRRLLVDAVLESRRRPGCSGPATAARRGDWSGWQRLAATGAAAHSPTPGHAWIHGRRVDLNLGDADEMVWGRRWDDGCGVVAEDADGVFHWSTTSTDGAFRMGTARNVDEAVQVAEASAIVPRVWREVAAAGEA